MAKPASKEPAPSLLAEAPKAQVSPTSSAAADLQALAPMLPPPLLIMPPGRDPSASPDALEEAFSALT